MRIDVFSNTTFIGEFDSVDIIKNNDSISAGKIITLKNNIYCINNVALKKNGTLHLDVYNASSSLMTELP